MAAHAADDDVERFDQRTLELIVLFGVSREVAEEAAAKEMRAGSPIIVVAQDGPESAIMLQFTRSDGSVFTRRCPPRPTNGRRRPLRRLLRRLGRA